MTELRPIIGGPLDGGTLATRVDDAKASRFTWFDERGTGQRYVYDRHTDSWRFEKAIEAKKGSK